jgi:predicted MFS family arabinose efflux permease|tara:strand:- start:14621 stop:15805 length:1185 start_codon:yes stop_codon:yes gene_type:complete
VSKQASLIQVLAVALLGVGALSAFMGLPYLVGLLSDKLQLTEQQSGWLVSADMIGICFISLLAPLWLRRFRWGVFTPFMLLIVVFVNAASAFTESYSTLILLRIIGGIAGGAIFTQAMVFLATGTHTERNIGIYAASATSWMCVCMIVMPLLSEQFGSVAGILFLAAIPLTCFVFLYWWPSEFVPDTASTPVSPQSLFSKPVCLALGCFILFTANVGILWGFVERIGAEYKFPTVELGQAIALANFISIGGGLIAASLGNRWGHFKPLAFALTIQAICLIIIAIYGGSFMLFTLVLSVYLLLWNFIDVFQISILMDVEPSGRAVGVVPAFISVGTALGPVIATLFMWGEGFSSVVVMAAILCGLTIATYGYLLSGQYAQKRILGAVEIMEIKGA